MQVGAEDSPERKRANQVFRHVLKPALEERGFVAERANEDPSPGRILPKIIESIIKSDLVVVDLTGRNPNVFYELGIAHSFTRPLISLADSADGLPFDVKDERVIVIGQNRGDGVLDVDDAEAARSSLRRSLDVVLAEGYEPPSPVRSVAVAQSLDAMAPSNPVVSELAQVGERLDSLSAFVEGSRGRGVRSLDDDLVVAMLERLLAQTSEIYSGLSVLGLTEAESTADVRAAQRILDADLRARNVRKSVAQGEMPTSTRPDSSLRHSSGRSRLQEERASRVAKDRLERGGRTAINNRDE